MEWKKHLHIYQIKICVIDMAEWINAWKGCVSDWPDGQTLFWFIQYASLYHLVGRMRIFNSWLPNNAFALESQDSYVSITV